MFSKRSFVGLQRRRLGLRPGPGMLAACVEVLMPRVVPTQIIALIDRVVSRPGMSSITRFLAPEQTPEISAIVDLISELPDELLVLSGDEYCNYRVDINALKDLLNFWQGPEPTTIINRQGEKGIQSMFRLRDLLAKCPDEAPSPSTAELSFIQDIDLRDSIRSDISAANRALHDGLWKAATVLAGAATEALLLWAIRNKKMPSEIEAARAAATPRASPDPNDWGLAGYIKVARNLSLIEDETEKQADLAKDFRNLIHPGRSDRLAKVCDRGTALSALAAVELVVRDLS
jgi:hypothetical protein